MQFVQKGILKVNNLLVLYLLVGVALADPSLNQEQTQQAAITKVSTRINLSQIQQQQSIQGQDTELSIALYQITNIPTWRNIVMIRDSKVSGNITSDLLTKNVNKFLIKNGHAELSSTQKTKIDLVVKNYQGSKDVPH